MIEIKAKKTSTQEEQKALSGTRGADVNWHLNDMPAAPMGPIELCKALFKKLRPPSMTP